MDSSYLIIQLSNDYGLSKIREKNGWRIFPSSIAIAQAAFPALSR